jgi:hypothetical protein
VRDTKRQDGKIIAVAMAASQTFRKGDLVIVDHSNGLAYPGPTGVTFAALDVCMGVAFESKVSTALATAAAIEWLRVDAEGVHDFTIATTDLPTSMGQVVYVDDTSTVNPSTVNLASTSHRPPAGKVVGLNSTTSVRVKLECPGVAA